MTAPSALLPLHVERRREIDRTAHFGDEDVSLLLTPPVGENYWVYRVRLTERQAVVGFPKFGTIGIGFAVEEDWNTNFPYGLPATEIANHIMHNKGDDSIPEDVVIDAIQMIRDAITSDALAPATGCQS